MILFLRKDDTSYMQMLLKESKYIEKDKKKVRYISDDPEISSDDSDKG